MSNMFLAYLEKKYEGKKVTLHKYTIDKDEVTLEYSFDLETSKYKEKVNVFELIAIFIKETEFDY